MKSEKNGSNIYKLKEKLYCGKRSVQRDIGFPEIQYVLFSNYS